MSDQDNIRQVTQVDHLAIIPIKTVSKRVPNKNFKMVDGKPLYTIIPLRCLEVFDSVYIDTDSEEIKSWAEQNGIGVIDREPVLTEDHANGNDLLRYEYETLYSAGIRWNFLWQVFCTAPFVSTNSILQMKHDLVHKDRIDSIASVQRMRGFFWDLTGPVNWRVDVMPRTQDARCLFKEIHGVFGIRTASFMKTMNRYGVSPSFYILPDAECADIDWPEDLEKVTQVSAPPPAAETVKRRSTMWDRDFEEKYRVDNED